MTKNAETAKNTIQTVFDPSFFHTMLGGALGNRAPKKTEKQTCYQGDMAMRKTTSRLRGRHTLSRPDFAKVHHVQSVPRPPTKAMTGLVGTAWGGSFRRV